MVAIPTSSRDALVEAAHDLLVRGVDEAGVHPVERGERPHGG